ncbi:type II secretion system minor pseudopilin GspK [Colwelliaceae bacterium 6471]
MRKLKVTVINQRGVALITVMLVVALAAILVTQMTGRLQLQMQRTSNITFNQQAYWYAMGAEAFAKRVLIASFEDDDSVTNLEQLWAQGETSYPVDFGQITGEISDLHACLNLNALRNVEQNTGEQKVTKTPARLALEELITALNIEGTGQFEAEYMVDALTDWLDDNSAIVSAGGAEDNDYSAKEFPYLPANHYLASVNELRIIEHFTVPVINALKDYVCVIPNNGDHKININTLSIEKPELLQALLAITLGDAQEILASREAEGFKSVDDFFNMPEVNKLKIDPDKKQQFVVDSDYFKLKTTASFNGSYFSLNSIMQVDKQKISVVSRTIGREL